MRSKISNMFENLLGRVLYASFYTMLIFPWVLLIMPFFCFWSPGINEYWLLGLAIIIGSLILYWSQRIAHTRLAQVATFVSFILLAILLARLSGAPGKPINQIPVSPRQMMIVVIAIFEILGFAYQKIVDEFDFTAKFTVGTVLMLLTLLLKDKYALYLPIHHILIFFLSGVLLSIYTKYLEVKEGGHQSRQSWASVIITVALIISIFSILLTFGLTEKAMILLLAPINFVANLLYNIFMEFILFFLVMLGPLLQLLTSIIPRQEGTWEESSPIQELADDLRSLQHNSNSSLDLTMALKVIVVLIVLLIAVYFIRRYQKKKNKEIGYFEERESIFDVEDVKNDFLHLLNSLRDRFRAKPAVTSIYDGSSIIMLIREIYYKFLMGFKEHVPYHKYMTPEEYLQKVQDEYPDQGELVAELTHIYELARYSPKVQEAELTTINDIYPKLHAKISSQKTPKPKK